MVLLEELLFEFTIVEACVFFLYGGFILLLILFGGDLLSRYIKADKRMRGDAAYRVFFIIAIAMIGYGIYTLPATVNYFLKQQFIENGFDLSWIAPLQFLLIMLMIGPIGFVCLKILFKKRKFVAYVLGIVGLLAAIYLFVITIVVWNDSSSIPNLLGSGYIYPIYAIILIFAIIDFSGIVYILIIELAPQKEVRQKILLGVIGIVVAAIGGYLEVSQRSDDKWLYVWGVVIELIGFLIMRHFFLSIKSYDEFAWKSGMIELHAIIAETGISLYYRAFTNHDKQSLSGDIRVTASIPESESRPNSDLVAGGLVGIKGMLAEISGDKGKLENIEIGEKSLVFKQGRVVLCLLLADENLGVYHSLLTDLVQLIEAHHPDLENFNGDTRQLRIEPLVNRVFGIASNDPEKIEEPKEA